MLRGFCDRLGLSHELVGSRGTFTDLLGRVGIPTEQEVLHADAGGKHVRLNAADDCRFVGQILEGIKGPFGIDQTDTSRAGQADKQGQDDPEPEKDLGCDLDVGKHGRHRFASPFAVAHIPSMCFWQCMGCFDPISTLPTPGLQPQPSGRTSCAPSNRNQDNESNYAKSRSLSHHPVNDRKRILPTRVPTNRPQRSHRQARKRASPSDRKGSIIGRSGDDRNSLRCVSDTQIYV